MKRFKFGLTCMALVVMSCANAMAGVWLSNNRAGSVSGSFDSFTPTAGDMSGSLSVTNFLYNSGASSRLGAFAGITEVGDLVWGGAFNFDPLGLTVGDVYNFTSATFGNFTGTVVAESSLNASSVNLTGNRTLDLTGIFTPGSNLHYEGDVIPLANTTVQIAFSRNPDMDNPGAINASWSLNTNSASPVPEPTSIAIFAFGAVGFAVRRFRRK